MPIQGYTVINNSAQVACGSCVDLMRAIPSESVDLVLTDPPYNLGLFMKERGTNMEKLRPNHFAFQGWDDLDFRTWCEQMNQFLAEKHKIPKNLVIVFSSWDNFIPENPYNLPMTYVEFKDKSRNTHIPQDSIKCTGSCPKCLGCFHLKKGGSVVFKKH